ncbi:MAG: hypothetical protein ACK5TO_20190, partial [Planctomycetaceae bacterium]
MNSLQEWFGRVVGVRGKVVDRGDVGEFIIEPPSEAMSVPAAHTISCVALDFLSSDRSKSLVVAVAEQLSRKQLAGPT